MKNYYEILEVNEHASKEIIEKAYRVLIKKYHPDLYTGEKRQIAEEKMRDINEAYKILSDDFLKEQYDAEYEREEIEKYVSRRTKTKKTQNVEKKEKVDNEEKVYQVGKLGNSVQLLKEIFKNKPKKIDVKELKREDFIAIGLTILTVIILGIILWFIPFTNWWMRQLLFENPLFSWIGN